MSSSALLYWVIITEVYYLWAIYKNNLLQKSPGVDFMPLLVTAAPPTGTAHPSPEVNLRLWWRQQQADNLLRWHRQSVCEQTSPWHAQGTNNTRKGCLSFRMAKGTRVTKYDKKPSSPMYQGAHTYKCSLYLGAKSRECCKKRNSSGSNYGTHSSLPLFASSLQDMSAATFPSLTVTAGQGGERVLRICCGLTEQRGSLAWPHGALQRWRSLLA